MLFILVTEWYLYKILLLVDKLVKENEVELGIECINRIAKID